MGITGAFADLRDVDLREPAAWEAVTTAATALTPAGHRGDRTVVNDTYSAEIRTLRDRIRSQTDLSIELPPTIAICDRHDYLAMMGGLVGRIAAAPAAGALVRGPQSLIAGGYAGMLGLLSRRVLGQVDPGLFTADGPRGLYIVEPNLRATAARLDAEPAVLRRWILAHELVHVAQFSSAPWLIAHLETRLEAVLSAAAQRELATAAMEELQAVMTVIEGHAEWQMDGLLADDVTALRAAVERRRRQPDPLLRLVGALVGLDQKRAQYVTGRAFFAAVDASQRPVDAARVFGGPEALPSPAELETPQRWIDRMAR
jgi:conserved hypothetical protein